MIEVKGPGDRLQDNQLRWLAYRYRRQASSHILDCARLEYGAIPQKYPTSL